MKTLRELERAARTAYERGESWFDFWARVSADVKALEPVCIERHRKIASRLLSLVVSGDAPRMIRQTAAPLWAADDEASKPSDCETAARCLWPGAVDFMASDS